jgi:phenylacetate-CoA ligase
MALRAAVGGPLPGAGEISAFRDRALRALVTHAYLRVPYYRRLFDRHGIRPADIRSVADLPAIPITTKNDLRAVPVKDTVADGLDPARLMQVTTSGVSGEPFTVRRTWLERRLTVCFWLRAKRCLGLRPSDRRASVAFIRTGRGHDPTLHMRLANALGLFRRLRLSCLEEPAEVLRALRTYRPDTISASPTVLARLAEEMTDDDRRVVQRRLLTTGGEVLTQRIVEAFGAPLYCFYGAHELSLIAWECKQTGEMHTCDDGLILEVLKDGRPAAVGDVGEPVGTNLHSYAMPFIRYQLGDVVTQGLPACACGAPFGTIRAVQGRVIDYFRLPGGRSMHPYEIVTQLLKVAPWIRRYQLVQERKDLVVLRVVASPGPSPEQAARLRAVVEPILGPGVAFRLDPVAAIPPGPGGKVRVLVSMVSREAS